MIQSRKPGPVDFLKEHHAQIDGEIAKFEESLRELRYSGGGTLPRHIRQLRQAMELFYLRLSRHVALEEQVFFPFMEKYVPRFEPMISFFKSEHESLRKNHEAVASSLKRFSRGRPDLNAGRELERLRGTATYLIYLLRNHAKVEDESIYKSANRDLNADEKAELARRIRDYQYS
ncbi:MAG: hemerythrin domain-containing protein [Candidatus Omnitrophica bacterium]|nr:hemerythrin domain-containing protein [Candidatus Omnitrophota bacterium]